MSKNNFNSNVKKEIDYILWLRRHIIRLEQKSSNSEEDDVRLECYEMEYISCLNKICFYLTKDVCPHIKIAIPVR